MASILRSPVLPNRSSRLGIILILLVTAALFGAIYALSHALLIEPRGNRFDIYPRLVGTAAFWNGESPYSRSVTERIQIGMYGAVLPPGLDEQRFAHPAYSAVLLAPLLLLPAEAVVGVWLTLQLLALAAVPLIWFTALGWRTPPLMALPLVLMLLAFRYPFLTYVFGQFTGTMVLCLSLGMLWLIKGKDSWAGAAFALEPCHRPHPGRSSC